MSVVYYGSVLYGPYGCGRSTPRLPFADDGPYSGESPALFTLQVHQKLEFIFVTLTLYVLILYSCHTRFEDYLLYCVDCEEDYCMDCDIVLHKRRTRRKHMRQPILVMPPDPSSSPGAGFSNCDNCNSQAFLHCPECQAKYCLDCDAILHLNMERWSSSIYTYNAHKPNHLLFSPQGSTHARRDRCPRSKS